MAVVAVNAHCLRQHYLLSAGARPRTVDSVPGGACEPIPAGSTVANREPAPPFGACAGTFAAWGAACRPSAAASATSSSVCRRPDGPRLLLPCVLTGVLLTGTGVPRGPVDSQTSMRPGSRGVVEGHSKFRIRHSLVSVQIALSLVRIVGAGLLGSWRRVNLDPISARGCSSGRCETSVPRSRTASADPRASSTLRVIPGVADASADCARRRH